MTQHDSIGGFHIGQSQSFEFAVTMEDQVAFSRLSGDENPLHLSFEHARTYGYNSPVVFGGLLLAKLSQVIGSVLPGTAGIWSSVQMDFRKPVLVGEHARLIAIVSQVSEAAHSLVLRVEIRCGDYLAVRGHATATLFPSSIS